MFLLSGQFAFDPLSAALFMTVITMKLADSGFEIELNCVGGGRRSPTQALASLEALSDK